MKPIAAFGMALALGGCSMTLPADRQAASGNEIFIGHVTGSMDAGGTLTLSSNRGLKCTGTIIYGTDFNRSGDFNCTNGQSGSFGFVSTDNRGTGIGRIGNKTFAFTLS
jgi:hypothetical protein